ncbi:MAG: hypothetical protein ACI4GY_03690, partial [Acutalibacteraceae bacterium]
LHTHRPLSRARVITAYRYLQYSLGSLLTAFLLYSLIVILSNFVIRNIRSNSIAKKRVNMRSFFLFAIAFLIKN